MDFESVLEIRNQAWSVAFYTSNVQRLLYWFSPLACLNNLPAEIIGPWSLVKVKKEVCISLKRIINK